MEIKTLGVVGAGQMGSGIAQVAAQAGVEVLCTDTAQAALDKASAVVDKSLGRLVKKERLTAEAAEAAAAAEAAEAVAAADAADAAAAAAAAAAEEAAEQELPSPPWRAFLLGRVLDFFQRGRRPAGIGPPASSRLRSKVSSSAVRVRSSSSTISNWAAPMA